MEKEERQEEILVKDGANKRIDVYLAEALPGVSRSQIKKWMEKGNVFLDGEVARPKDRVHDGAVIRLGEKAELPQPSHLTPSEMPLAILYEDAQVIVINKPAGLVVHPGAGTTGPTLVEGLLYHFGLRGPQEGSQRPGIVHRLDKDTSGVLVCAKNPTAHDHLAKQFAAKSNLREYLALVKGHLKEDTLEVRSYLGRNPKDRRTLVSISEEVYQSKTEPGDWRLAISHFSVRSRFRVGDLRLTLVDVCLATGRTHQIRVHAKAIGHPVWGDPLYGEGLGKAPPFLARVTRQMLHARYLGFAHPTTGENVAFEADLPEDFREVLQGLKP